MASGISEMIQEMVRRIVDQHHPERIILFGSHARGEGAADSDVDLLVVFQRLETSRHETTAEIYKTLRSIRIPFDVIVTSLDRFERYKDVPNTIYWPAVREGKTVYERRPEVLEIVRRWVSKAEGDEANNCHEECVGQSV